MLECVREGKGGVLIDVHVIPNSKKLGFSYDGWEKRLKVRVSAPAVRGKANKEIINNFSSLFRHCEIVVGKTSRKKTLLVKGRTSGDVGSVLVSLII